MPRPTCPECGKHDVGEIAATRTFYPVLTITDDGEPETGVGRTCSDGEFDGFQCGHCGYEAEKLAAFIPED